MEIKRGIIGYTGTVGKNLLNQIHFTDMYNSKNIESIRDQEFDELYLTCLPATKWMINKNPSNDDENTLNLMTILNSVKSKYTVLISSIDVYPIKNNQSDENYFVDSDDKNHDTYGKNRCMFENFIIGNFSDHIVIRLPGIFGDNIKKNVIFDLLNNNNIDKINKQSKFQWYFLDNLSEDINKCINITNKYKPQEKDVNIINFFTEPIYTKQIIELFFPEKINEAINNENTTEYNLCTKLDESGYLYNKEQILEQINLYINRFNVNKCMNCVTMNNIIFSNIAWNVNENDQILDILSEHKMNKVELALTKFYKWEDIDYSNLITIKNYFENNNFKIYSLQAITYGLDYNLFSETDKLFGHVKDVLYYAHILGCKRIVFGSPKNRSHNDNFNESTAINFFTELNILAKQHDIIVCIEPNAREYGCNFLWNLEQTYEFVKKLKCSHIKMMADTGCMSFENDDISDIYKYKDEIEHIHLSERYLNPLTNIHTNHEKLSDILLDSNKTFVTVEMTECGNNISNIYNTILFIKNNYNMFIHKRNCF
jgi:sugar phosphate isomerase/epimerase